MAGSDGVVIIRELEAGDMKRGFLAALDSLRPQASRIRQDRALEIFKGIESDPNHIIVVADADGQVVGAATLLIEPKFIHGGGMAGHIEDVAVRDGFQGRGIGRRIVKHLLGVAAGRGCYKTVLDCTDDVRPFYEKMGFRCTAGQMRVDHS